MTQAIRWASMVIMFASVLFTPGATLAQGFPSQQGGQATGDGRVHQFQEFGFSITWGAEWQVVELAGGPDTGFEGIALDNGVSNVTIMGIATTDSPQRIATVIADNHPLRPELSVVLDDTPTLARGWYIPDDVMTMLSVHISARTLDNTTAMAVIWVFPILEMEDELDSFNALMDGLR